jgi:fibronectin-binding autotransporter adhesin
VAGAGGAGTTTGQAGQHGGDAFFLQGSGVLAFSPGAGLTQTVTGSISDEQGFLAANPSYTPPAGFVAGSWGLAKNGVGMLTLSGANSYSGGTSLNAGTLSVSADSNLGAATGGLSFNGGILQVTGTAFTSTPRTIVWGANGGGFDVAAAANTFTVSQNLTGTGPLTKLGPGTLALTGANTYTGGTTLTSGTIRVGTFNALGSGTLTLDGGMLKQGGAAVIGNAIAINSTGGTIDAAASGFQLGGNISDGSGTPTAALTIISTGGPGWWRCPATTPIRRQRM